MLFFYQFPTKRLAGIDQKKKGKALKDKKCLIHRKEGDEILAKTIPSLDPVPPPHR